MLDQYYDLVSKYYDALGQEQELDKLDMTGRNYDNINALGPLHTTFLTICRGIFIFFLCHQSTNMYIGKYTSKLFRVIRT